MRRRKKIQNKSESESDTCNVSMLAKNVQDQSKKEVILNE